MTRADRSRQANQISVVDEGGLEGGRGAMQSRVRITCRESATGKGSGGGARPVFG